MSISMKWSLVNCESLDTNSDKIVGFYKGDNFKNKGDNFKNKTFKKTKKN